MQTPVILLPASICVHMWSHSHPIKCHRKCLKYLFTYSIKEIFEIPFPISVSIDDFYRGTRAALVGGTTTVVDCVAPESGESLMDAYNKWRGWAEDKVCCNYALRFDI